MRAVAAIIIALAAAGGLTGLVAGALGARRRSLEARSPARAFVEPGDSTSTIKAKQRAYERYLNAMRLLGEVQKRDELLGLLDFDLRKEIDEAVEDFYGGA